MTTGKLVVRGSAFARCRELRRTGLRISTCLP